MNPRNMSRSKLIDFTAKVATRVAAGKVTGFLAAQNTDISDALTAANTVLASAEGDTIDTRIDAVAATQFAVDAQETVLKLLHDLKSAMAGVDSSTAIYDVIGFDPPVEVRQIVMPQTPTELSGAGYSNGINALKFVGNNRPGSVTYVIEAKIGDTAPYVIVGTSTRQSFKHTDVTPGEFYQYRVRAQAARGLVSDWSNEAVVYGV